MSAGAFGRFDASVVEWFEFDRGEVVDGAVCAVVVEPQHPGRDFDLDVVDISPGPFVMDEFGLKSDLGRRMRVQMSRRGGDCGEVDSVYLLIRGGVRLPAPSSPSNTEGRVADALTLERHNPFPT